MPSHPSAKKSLGQNFLTNPDILQTIAHAVPLEDRLVVEIGPGPGALTEHIVRADPVHLTLVELDTRMVTHLTHRMGTDLADYRDCIDIVREDIMTWVPPSDPYILLGNIPYYITSPILRRFLYDVADRPTDIVFTMQAEVADRILETDGHSSYLSILVHLACERVELVTYISRTDFDPVPDVDSAVIACHLRPIDHETTDAFLAFVRAGYAHPRKKLVSNLADAHYGTKTILSDTFTALGIRPDIRPDAVHLDAWQAMYAIITAVKE